MVVLMNVNPLPEAVISAYPQPATFLNPQINFTDESNGHINGVLGILMMELHNLPILIRFLIYSDTGTYQVTLTVETDSGCIDIASQTIYISCIYNLRS